MTQKPSDLSNRTAKTDDDKMPFGKYAGQRLGDVPDSYWMWFLSQSWCDSYAGLVEYANHCVDD